MFNEYTDDQLMNLAMSNEPYAAEAAHALSERYAAKYSETSDEQYQSMAEQWKQQAEDLGYVPQINSDIIPPLPDACVESAPSQMDIWYGECLAGLYKNMSVEELQSVDDNRNPYALVECGKSIDVSSNNEEKICIQIDLFEKAIKLLKDYIDSLTSNNDVAVLKSKKQNVTFLANLYVLLGDCYTSFISYVQNNKQKNSDKCNIYDFFEKAQKCYENAYELDKRNAFSLVKYYDHHTIFNGTEEDKEQRILSILKDKARRDNNAEDYVNIAYRYSEKARKLNGRDRTEKYELYVNAASEYFSTAKSINTNDNKSPASYVDFISTLIEIEERKLKLNRSTYSQILDDELLNKIKKFAPLESTQNDGFSYAYYVCGQYYQFKNFNTLTSVENAMKYYKLGADILKDEAVDKKRFCELAAMQSIKEYDRLLAEEKAKRLDDGIVYQDKSVEDNSFASTQENSSPTEDTMPAPFMKKVTNGFAKLFGFK